MALMASSPAQPAPSLSRPPQFSLRGMLLLTAAVAVGCALISWLGVVWLPLVLGMTLYLANYLGMFGLLQRRVVAQTALYLAGLAWAVSMVMPIKPNYFRWGYGWDIAWDGVRVWSDGLRGNIFPLSSVQPPWVRLLLRAGWMTVFGLTNLANLALP